jgi:uncharacterized protein YndB with AHSA1/START domain
LSAGGGVSVEVEIDAPVEVVWEFLTNPARIIEWLGISASLDPRPGGEFRFELFEGQYCSGRYVEVVQQQRVVFTWGWEDPTIPVPPGSSTVAITLEPRGSERTILRLVHTGLDQGMEPLHADGWRRYLARLAAVARGSEPPSDPSRPYRGPAGLPNPLAGGDES